MEHIKGKKKKKNSQVSVCMIRHGFKLLISEKIMKMKETWISFTCGRTPLILHPQDRTGARLANILDFHTVPILT